MFKSLSVITVSLFLALPSGAVVTSSQQAAATPAPTNKDINSNAGSGKTMQIVGAATNAGMAAFLVTKCPVPVPCALGALAAAQAVQMLMASGGSGKTKAATDASLSGVCVAGTSCIDNDGDGIADNYDDTSGYNNSATGQLSDTISSQTKGIISTAAKNGYIANSDGTVTMPDGKTVSGSTLASAQGMSDFGMTPSEISDLNAGIASAGDKAYRDAARAVALETTDGGGGGSSYANGAKNGRTTASTSGLDLSSLFGKKKPTSKDASAAGLSKKLGSDNIGVAGDDLFKMMTRQYQKQNANNEFIGSAFIPLGSGPAKPAGH